MKQFELIYEMIYVQYISYVAFTMSYFFTNIDMHL